MIENSKSEPTDAGGFNLSNMISGDTLEKLLAVAPQFMEIFTAPEAPEQQESESTMVELTAEQFTVSAPEPEQKLTGVRAMLVQAISDPKQALSSAKSGAGKYLGQVNEKLQSLNEKLTAQETMARQEAASVAQLESALALLKSQVGANSSLTRLIEQSEKKLAYHKARVFVATSAAASLRNVIKLQKAVVAAGGAVRDAYND